MEKGPYMCGQMGMAVKMEITVLLMAMHPVYTPYLLELLELMGGQVFFDEPCSAKMVVSYVTNENGTQTIVSLFHTIMQTLALFLDYN